MEKGNDKTTTKIEEYKTAYKNTEDIVPIYFKSSQIKSITPTEDIKAMFEDENSKYTIKEHQEHQIYIKLQQDEIIDIKGSGTVYIVVEKDIELILNFNDDKDNFSSAIVKILLAENVNLNLFEFSNSANLWQSMQIIQKTNSTLNHYQITKNAKINETITNLNKYSKYELIAVNYSNKVNLDIYNEAIHKNINAQSYMKIRNIANNNSKIISNSKIVIEQIANNSKGHQKIENLILDENSRIDAEPILEIENNNVECSHGATVSQIADDVLFYLNSRGLRQEDAVKLIVDNYFSEILDKVTNKDFDVDSDKLE